MQAVRVKGVSNPMQFPDDMDIDDIREFLRRRFTQQAVAGNQPIELGDRPQLMQAYEPTLQEKTATAIGEGLYNSGIISDRYGAQNIGKNVSNIAAFSPAGAAFGGDEFGTAAKKGDKLGMALGALEGVGIGGDIAKLAIFGGVLAKSADLGALAKAKKLEADGADRDQIWKETGWANDKGDWKFEIDDSAAKSLTIPRESGAMRVTETLSHPELERGYKGVSNIAISRDRSRNYYSPDMGVIRMQARSPASNLVVDKYNKLEDMLLDKADELNQAGKFTPELEDKLQKDLAKLADRARNEVKSKTGEVFDKSVQLHELQHAIQRDERFASGGSPEEFADNYNKSLHNKNYNESEATNARLAARKTPEYKALQSEID